MRYDVAVVGAGPSGAWTATLLAQRGARVALIDPSHPREKPCGGGITGRALALVGDRLRRADLPAVAVGTARFVDSARNTSAVVPLDARPGALVVASRAAFDSLLHASAGRAGASLVAERVAGLSRGVRGWRLTLGSHRTIEADLIVGADGANSLVRRKVAAMFRRHQLSIATGYFAHGRTSDEIVVEMVADPPGYIWSFPRPDHLAIGVCAQADTGAGVERLRRLVRTWIHHTGIAPGARLEPYAWPIPSLASGDFTSLPVAGPGWLTVGDAAGLVDPITREGIYFALRSAGMAADAVSAGDARAWRVFSDQVRDEIGSELGRAARYKAGFFRPRFARLLMTALQASGPVRAVMADLVAGTQSYRALKWRLAGTFETGLAWQLARSGWRRE